MMQKAKTQTVPAKGMAAFNRTKPRLLTPEFPWSAILLTLPSICQSIGASEERARSEPASRAQHAPASSANPLLGNIIIMRCKTSIPTADI
jgi:hypothetical protein